MDIIEKIKKENLIGRGGAGYPTWQKWKAVKTAKGDKKYVVCNASEGEPMVDKDKYILENYLDDVINGIKIAMDTIEADEAYFYLNKNYFKNFENKIKLASKGINLKIFKKPDGYISGEETTILNVIEGRIKEPRMKPPYPTEKGLFGCPTLINNVETFYYVSKIAKGEYKKTRFYSIAGDAKKKGTYELAEDMAIGQILTGTKNMPDFEFFVQVGGGASGEILTSDELERPVSGMGSIIIYNKEKTNPLLLMRKWADFFVKGNCDKCAPCREGVYRIKEILKGEKINYDGLKNILFVLETTSFCALGKNVSRPFNSLISKVLND